MLLVSLIWSEPRDAETLVDQLVLLWDIECDNGKNNNI
jgi:hypothetical protein